jgi:hypothetical protein
LTQARTLADAAPRDYNVDDQRGPGALCEEGLMANSTPRRVHGPPPPPSGKGSSKGGKHAKKSAKKKK